MGTWILLIAIISANDSRAGPANMSVPGFVTKAACETAAQAFKAQVGLDTNQRNPQSRVLVSTTCVSTDGAVR